MAACMGFGGKQRDHIRDVNKTNGPTFLINYGQLADLVLGKASHRFSDRRC
jgi:hypothetical protein